MKKNLIKYGKYIGITLLLLVLLVICKLQVNGRDTKAAEIPNILKNKEVITVWLREGTDTETRVYQVEKFNTENKSIFIDFKIYKEDYFNLLRISLASDNKSDIFQYGYYELLKNDKYTDLDDLNINTLNINPNNFLYFDGKKVGVKTAGNNVKFLFNKEIFKKAGLSTDVPPKTWKEVETDAKIIKDKVPSIIPFEFPANTWGEIKSSIGEVAATKGSIYTTFWNYKTGIYDFSYAKDILNVFKDMYSQGLTQSALEKKGAIDMRRDFHSQNVAMIISTYEDRNYFSSIVPLEFSYGISDLPKLSSKDIGKYFYTENYTCLVVNKNIKDKVAVKKVLAWLLSNETNQELFDTGKVLPSVGENLKNNNLSFAAFADSKNFEQEKLDPTIYTNYSPDVSKKLFIDAITGSKSIDQAITALNSQYAQNVNFMKKADNMDFSKYIINK